MITENGERVCLPFTVHRLLFDPLVDASGQALSFYHGYSTFPLLTLKSTTFFIQDQRESCCSGALDATTCRRQPSMTSASWVQRRTRLRGTCFSHRCATRGDAYRSRTVTLRDRYSRGVRFTRRYRSSPLAPGISGTPSENIT